MNLQSHTQQILAEFEEKSPLAFDGRKWAKDFVIKTLSSRDAEWRKRIEEVLLSEEMEMLAGDMVNDLLEYRGIYDCGKSMRGGVKDIVLQRINSRAQRLLAGEEEASNKQHYERNIPMGE